MRLVKTDKEKKIQEEWSQRIARFSINEEVALRKKIKICNEEAIVLKLEK